MAIAEVQQVRILSAAEVLAADDIEEKTLFVKQWNGGVKIRTLSQKQAGELRKRATRTNLVTKQSEIDNEALEAMLFIEGVVDPKFTMADYGKLQEKSMAAMSYVLKEIMKASGLSDEAVTDATKSDEESADVEV
jgi:hypothetical protein